MSKKKGNNKKWKLLILFIVIVLALVGIGAYGMLSVLNKDTIYERIKIGKFDVSNMAKKEALDLMEKELDEDLLGKQMNLKYEDKVYNVGLKELGFCYNYEKAIDEAYSVGREGSILKRFKKIMDTRKYGEKIELGTSYDKDLINKLAEEIAGDIDLESKEAVFNFNGGKMSVTQEVIGRKVNTELLKQLIEENIYKLEDIEIPVEKIEPNMKKDSLSRINGIIGEFSTSFKTSSSDRKENIRVAGKAISGKLIMPGGSFSFNETTGARSKQNGYKEANVIVSGEFTPGLGGGVCQVSTTLYNALIRADLSILERHPHSIPATYVGYGQDAAVSYGHMDLKFKNSFDFPVYLHTKVAGDKIFIYVYGDVNAKNYNVKIDSEIVEKIDPKVEAIPDKKIGPSEKVTVQSGRTGYKVKTYKTIIKNGKVLKRELITSDFYKPRDYIYRFGPELEKELDSSMEQDETLFDDIEEE